ncbi:HLH transcription factor [Paecilomyces variotii No. 5]|uniref:HLH transcription factor n=1 Tax=Byssochlamys spectabilis (strain No. 5 / NBRC 109023) TaxID=1356009 RepID=V5G2M3_BYSSN|nr:HLH transcription factor [Paecilomyces variotii No. 5]
MHFNILALTVALAGAASALPKLPAVSWNQTHAVTSLHAANLTMHATTNFTTSRTAQKSNTNTLASQAGSSDSNNVCTTLCSLQAQICSMALPTHDDYCWGEVSRAHSTRHSDLLHISDDRLGLEAQSAASWGVLGPAAGDAIATLLKSSCAPPCVQRGVLFIQNFAPKLGIRSLQAILPIIELCKDSAMPPPRLPPTPSMSGELIIKDQSFPEGSEAFFSLPPAALPPSAAEGAGKRETKMDAAAYRPASPTSPHAASAARNSNPPRKAGTKRPLEEFDLPPPPTRTRKIIQMKPKAQPPAKTDAESKSKDAGKAQSNGNAQSNNPSKKKQPSATSAAGRKIARKTAHSLIERRRRSKMNEEFGTLKDMIPACKGQEMHKLAILQASIDYVNYLEQCISDLKTAGSSSVGSTLPPPGPPSPTSPDFLPGSQQSGESLSSSASPELMPDHSQNSNMSPSLSPRSHHYQAQLPTELRSSMLPSPALGPSQSRESSVRSPEHSWVLSNVPSVSASPAIQPQRNSVSYRDGDVDHEASAALLMLNMDRRGTLDSTKEMPPSSLPPPSDSNRKMGMSVRDLLIS